MNLTSSVATSSSSVDSPIASRSPGILKASSRQVGLSGKPDASTNQNSNPVATSSSQGWQRDAQLFISTGKPLTTDKDQKSLNRQEESVTSTGKLVTTEYQGYSGNPEVPKDSEDSERQSRIWPHHFRKSPDCVPHMEKVFSIVRKIDDQKPTDDLNDFDVDTAIWCIFMSLTLQAAVHLGRYYSLNLRSAKNQLSKSAEQLFRTTEKLINRQTEITKLSTINWDQPLWRKSSPLCESCSNYKIQHLRLFWLDAMFGRNQSRTSSSVERQN